MRYNYRSCYLLTTENTGVNFNKEESSRFEESLLILRPDKIVVEKNRVCVMTAM